MEEGELEEEEEEDWHDNNLYYLRGPNLAHIPLDPVHSALCVRRVPPGHPAYGGHGVYARRAIRPNTYLGTYSGIYRSIQVADTTPWCFAVNNHLYVVDAKYHRNMLAYVNDPRGVPQAGGANVTTREKVIEKGGRNSVKLATVAFYTLRVIEEGEELLLDYGEFYDMNMGSAPVTPPRQVAQERRETEVEEERGDYVPFTRAARMLFVQLAQLARPMERMSSVHPDAQDRLIYTLQKAVSECCEAEEMIADEERMRELRAPARPGYLRCKMCSENKVLHPAVFDARLAICQQCMRRLRKRKLN